MLKCQSRRDMFLQNKDHMKRTIKRIPIVGHIASITKRWWDSHVAPRYAHVRMDLTPESGQGPSRGARQIQNLLSYTKTSGSAYAAVKFPAGYHTIEVNDHVFAGQRKPSERLSGVPFDFAGKTVLDIGCNQGGMLFALQQSIRQGIGIDFDSRMVNAANRVRAVQQYHNLEFYVFNLETEALEIVEDFLPSPNVDIVFLLSVCMWINNWRDVIDFSANVSNHLLFESNGSPKQQADQIRHLRSRYRAVTLIRETSPDDPNRTRRDLYLCTR